MTSDGNPVGEFRLVADPADPTLVYLQPPLRIVQTSDAGPQRQTWDNGARVQVTIDPELPDVFGATLGVTSTASFLACSRCAATDGGTAPDALDPDAPVDAGAAPDADPDASAD